MRAWLGKIGRAIASAPDRKGWYLFWLIWDAAYLLYLGTRLDNYIEQGILWMWFFMVALFFGLMLWMFFQAWRLAFDKGWDEHAEIGREIHRIRMEVLERSRGLGSRIHPTT